MSGAAARPGEEQEPPSEAAGPYVRKRVERASGVAGRAVTGGLLVGGTGGLLCLQTGSDGVTVSRE